MRLGAILAALVVFGGCGGLGAKAAAAADPRLTAGTALAEPPAPTSEGERLFDADCVICHAAGKLYPGYFALRQQGSPEPELSRRVDLDAGYVKSVVRNGLGAMPAFTPTHVSDVDLDAIAGYLARAR